MHSFKCGLGTRRRLGCVSCTLGAKMGAFAGVAFMCLLIEVWLRKVTLHPIHLKSFTWFVRLVFYAAVNYPLHISIYLQELYNGHLLTIFKLLCCHLLTSQAPASLDHLSSPKGR